MLWREYLKSGPLSGLYGFLRNVKRNSLQEPIGGIVHQSLSAKRLSELKPLAAELGHTARFHFSLSWAYIEQKQWMEALASARNAEFLGFESLARLYFIIVICSHKLGFNNLLNTYLPFIREDEFSGTEFELWKHFEVTEVNKVVADELPTNRQKVMLQDMALLSDSVVNPGWLIFCPLNSLCGTLAENLLLRRSFEGALPLNEGIQNPVAVNAPGTLKVF